MLASGGPWGVSFGTDQGEDIMKYLRKDILKFSIFS